MTPRGAAAARATAVRPVRGAGATPAALVAAARASRRRAYAPYSGYRVGAAVLTADGAVFTGANVENASYGLSLCAERAAIITAVAAGHRRLRAVAVAVGGPEAAPCGACRQVMAEFGVTEVYLAGRGGRVQVRRLADLLPGAFTRAALAAARPRARDRGTRTPAHAGRTPRRARPRR
ncbi:MAG: cytidine deaminase [Armatimonadota bacterium]|nr:cytidine deaminase [Armatimonadota bacterium]MDR7447904.1 cytidine deaminase [Armatimonadota bacterium]MDR7460635.1 cytidine deaminase [Armatimonadota bacterium]MDR7479748.1 cytidine deaminase [Armatimonadota bacterium]MDR7489480.1 cytidine deaminase [Armatimonadota bacterium]